MLQTLINSENVWGSAVVSALQRQLSDAGVYRAPVDGKFGLLTRQALIDISAKYENVSLRNLDS